MKKKLTLIMLHLICAAKLFAQQDSGREAIDRATDSIQNEGKALYRSEWASWYGTDVFVAKCPDKRPLSGGYFSYETDSNLVNLFFSKGDDPVVIATITFGKDFNTESFKLDTVQRKFSKTETGYYTIRKAAANRIDKDTIFKSYNNTNLNIIPLIEKGTQKVYILTGPNKNGVVIFGNDYLINFNKASEITTVRKLHKNLIPIYTKTENNQTTLTAIHSHLSSTGDFITATDICTLMLYEKRTTWTQHVVISQNYVSIWDCKKDLLVILTKEAWDKISASERAGLKKE